MRYRILTLVLISMILGSCSYKGESELSKALSGAVKQKKLSSKKMEIILTEYDKLRDEDKIKAREYVDQVLSAIEMGGDSSHIDAARRQVMRKQVEKKV